MTYVDKVMAPTSWLETIFYKPIWLIKALRIALPWKFKTEIPATHPGVLSFFQTLRTSEPPFATDNLKIGAAGFCWGGKHAFILAQDKPETQVVRHESQIEHTKDMRLLDCAFTAHPSYINPPDDVISVTIPMSVSVGDVDMALKEAKAIEMKKILEAVDGNMHEVIILSGAKHGFAVRSRPDDKHEMEMAAKAEVQAIEWFRRWLV
jgi:dienelactone hydrolase